MRRKRLVLSICASLCVVLIGIVVAVVFLSPKHTHKLSESRTYHISNSSIYYTRACAKGCEIKYQEDITIVDLFASVRAQDKIVLDENVVLNEELVLKGFSGEQELDLNINLDLNNFRLSSNVSNKNYNSLFMLNANRGSIKLNISNGHLYSNDLLYIFRFSNNGEMGGDIELNLNKVNCEVLGNRATPLYAQGTVSTTRDGTISMTNALMKINATNSKFISTCANHNYGADCDYCGVGAFINSASDFNFTNCEFFGGDGVFVKQGNLNLTNCKLANSALVPPTTLTAQRSSDFDAVGASLLVDNYTTSEGTTKFNIVIKNCIMNSDSGKGIYVVETADEGLELAVNSESFIDVQSCGVAKVNPIEDLSVHPVVDYADYKGYDSTNQVFVFGDMNFANIGCY